MDEGRPGMIPSVNVKTSVPTLSALQLVKGVKKDEETFVAHPFLNPLFRLLPVHGGLYESPV